MKPAQAAVDRWLKKHPKSQTALVSGHEAYATCLGSL